MKKAMTYYFSVSEFNGVTKEATDGVVLLGIEATSWTWMSSKDLTERAIYGKLSAHTGWDIRNVYVDIKKRKVIVQVQED